MDNQSGSVLQSQESSYDLAVSQTVSNSPIPDMNDRIRQQQIIPAAVKGRLMQPVQDDGATILTVSATVPDGASVIASLTTTSTNGGMVLAQVYWQVYIDNLIPTQRMPDVISSKNFPYYVLPKLYDKNGLPINNQPGKSVSALQVRNNDGMAHRIFIQSYPRMIINGSGNTTS